MPLAGADPAAVAAYVGRAVREGVIDDVRAVGGRLHLGASRATLWQHPLPWLRAPGSGGMPLHYAVTNERRHPVRAPTVPGEIYARHMPKVGCTRGGAGCPRWPFGVWTARKQA
ncbi:hypothetical protein WJ32_08970 [Burkholderia ubonensis]|uniref:Uncharacterized protein n=1 Tax=Burkholderia ubonensis TaxID=101571 RepID=A0A103QVW0_9BURK|nr:hypothetical protein [Burkholderia ubonensis]AOJ62579.1 hypothetical protein WJ32_08970 [Burkholderia ubonensis]KVG56542.1 hypothetical protein WJ33_37635 [Burkholderia ubonensis]